VCNFLGTGLDGFPDLVEHDRSSNDLVADLDTLEHDI
jgi:hypothetical protein